MMPATCAVGSNNPGSAETGTTDGVGMAVVVAAGEREGDGAALYDERHGVVRASTATTAATAATDNPAAIQRPRLRLRGGGPTCHRAGCGGEGRETRRHPGAGG